MMSSSPPSPHQPPERLERWVCPVCGGAGSEDACTGPYADPHEVAEPELVEYVPAASAERLAEAATELLAMYDGKAFTTWPQGRWGDLRSALSEYHSQKDPGRG